MNLYDILNSIDLTLGKNFKSYNNSIIDNFTDELKKHIEIKNSIQILSKLPKDTLFTIDRYEGDFAVCENRTDGKMYNIPKSIIVNSAKENDILKFNNGQYDIDYIETEKQRENIKNLINKINKK